TSTLRRRTVVVSLEQVTNQVPSLIVIQCRPLECSSVTLSLMKNNTSRIVASIALPASRLERMAFCTFMRPFLTSADIEAADKSLNSASNPDNWVEIIDAADPSDCKLSSWVSNSVRLFSNAVVIPTNSSVLSLILLDNSLIATPTCFAASDPYSESPNEVTVSAACIKLFSSLCAAFSKSPPCFPNAVTSLATSADRISCGNCIAASRPSTSFSEDSNPALIIAVIFWYSSEILSRTSTNDCIRSWCMAPRSLAARSLKELISIVASLICCVSSAA